MKDKYDVIIIGAGIGGLVCGCYLAKAGFRVLLVEQHNQVGGYCTSFRRNGFIFDAAVHYIGAARHEGEINKIVNELSLSKRIKWIRFDPCDEIRMPDNVVYIRKSYQETINEFKKSFPKQKNKIDIFFSLIFNKNFFYIYGKLKQLTFKELLDSLFADDYRIKGTIGVLLGNLGLPPSKISALTALYLYKEFILDPGYYPDGGVQTFADSLAEKLVDLGGSVLLSKRVDKIIIKNNIVSGILVNKQLYMCKNIVSNADASQTYLELINTNDKKIINKIKKMKVSSSAFAVYLGLKIAKKELNNIKCALWNFSTYNIEKCYGNPEINYSKKKKKMNYFICTFPSFHSSQMAPKNKTAMEIFILAPFKTERYWEREKEYIKNKLISEASAIIPNLEGLTATSEIATPQTFHRYTLNRAGAMYGWASTPTQIEKSLFPQKTYIKGLYLAGHWCTNGLGQGGVSEVAFTGRRAATLILKEQNKQAKLRKYHVPV